MNGCGTRAPIALETRAITLHAEPELACMSRTRELVLSPRNFDRLQLGLLQAHTPAPVRVSAGAFDRSGDMCEVAPRRIEAIAETPRLLRTRGKATFRTATDFCTASLSTSASCRAQLLLARVVCRSRHCPYSLSDIEESGNTETNVCARAPPANCELQTLTLSAAERACGDKDDESESDPVAGARTTASSSSKSFVLSECS